VTRSKVKVTEVRHVREWLISRDISSARIHVIKTLTVYSKTISEFYLNGSLIFVLVQSHMTFKLRVFCLWQTSFGSYKESAYS